MTAFLSGTAWRGIAFATFIATIWLNQSVDRKEWEALRDRTFAAPQDHVAEYLRYPFIFLYRRSDDEAIYFETASATLGLPYDAAVFARRGDSPLPPVSVPVDGRFHAPYAEVPFEYPPVNLPFILGPRLASGGFKTFGILFGGLMGSLLVLAAILGAKVGTRGRIAEARSGDDRSDETRLVVFGALLLAHGALAVQRLDAIVAMLAILMVRAAVRGDDRRLGFWAGLIFATKLIPFLLLPVIVIAAGIRGARRFGAITAGAGIGLALGFGPMVLFGGEPLPLLLGYHWSRGLQVESSFGVIYGAAKALLGLHEASARDYGSFNFHGPLPQLLAQASFAFTLALVGLVAYATNRGRASDDGETARTERIVLASLATMTALWLGGKVFSPQYLTWALPLAIAVPGRAWTRIALGLGVVLLISQIYLRGYYDYVCNQSPAGVITMTLRLAILVGLFVVALRRLGGWSTWSRPEGPPQ